MTVSPRTIAPGRCAACGNDLLDAGGSLPDTEGQIDVRVGREFPPQHLLATFCADCGIAGLERWLKAGLRHLKWEERFWSKVERVRDATGMEHWHWMRSEATRGPRTGIARAHIPVPGEGGTKKVTTVQRVVYEMFHGPIEDGRYVVRTCTDGLCIHPDHLGLATRGNAMAGTPNGVPQGVYVPARLGREEDE